MGERHSERGKESKEEAIDALRGIMMMKKRHRMMEPWVRWMMMSVFCSTLAPFAL